MPRRGTARRVTAGLSILGILALSVLPSEHLHARHATDGQRRDIVHRHLEAHHSSPAGSRVGHDEAAPRWLDAPYVNADPVTTVDRPDLCYECDAPDAAPRQVRRAAAGVVSMPIHDPPLRAALGLRAPPFTAL